MRVLLLILFFLVKADLHGAINPLFENKWLGCMLGLARLHLYVHVSPLQIIEKTEKLIIENPEVINYQAKGNHGTLLHQVIKSLFKSLDKYLDNQRILSGLNRLVSLLLEKNVDLTAEILIKNSSSRTPLELTLAYSTFKDKESYGYYIFTLVIDKLKEAMQQRNIPIREALPWSQRALFDLAEIDELCGDKE